MTAPAPAPAGGVRGVVHLSDGVEVARRLEAGSVDLVYLDPRGSRRGRWCSRN